MSDFGDDFYRENILDHYKSPRNYGELEHPDAHAEGMNPLCGDETAIAVKFGLDGETIEDIRFLGRGCAISVASTSMLTELVKGRKKTSKLKWRCNGMTLIQNLFTLIAITSIRLKEEHT